MPRSKGRYSQTARALRLIDRLRGHRRPVPLTALAEHFEVTKRQVRRDLLALEEAGYVIEQELHEGQAAVRLVEKSYTQVPITRRERYTILAVRSVFDVLRGTPFYEDVQSVCEKLMGKLGSRERTDLETFGDRFIYVPEAAAPKNTPAKKTYSTHCRPASSVAAS